MPLFEPVDRVCCLDRALLDAAMACISCCINGAVCGQLRVRKEGLHVLVEGALVALKLSDDEWRIEKVISVISVKDRGPMYR